MPVVRCRNLLTLIIQQPPAPFRLRRLLVLIVLVLHLSLLIISLRVEPARSPSSQAPWRKRTNTWKQSERELSLSPGIGGGVHMKWRSCFGIFILQRTSKRWRPEAQSQHDHLKNYETIPKPVQTTSSGSLSAPCSLFFILLSNKGRHLPQSMW